MDKRIVIQASKRSNQYVSLAPVPIVSELDDAQDLIVVGVQYTVRPPVFLNAREASLPGKLISLGKGEVHVQ